MPKLTPEEKLELKAKKKLEKKQKLEEKKIQLKYDYLQREIHYGKQTIKKHEKTWRQMLLNIALPRMRTELEFAWHNFERIIDAKDFTISLLMDEIADAEEQYMMNMRTHNDNIDNLINLYRDQLQELKVDNEAGIKKLHSYALIEMEAIHQTFIENEEYMKTMLYGLELTRKEQEKLVRGEYLSKMNVETMKLKEICLKIREDLESRFDDLWNTTECFLKEYVKATEKRKADYEYLRDQDEVMQNIIKKQWIKIRKAHDKIKRLRVMFADMQVSQGRQLTELRKERSHFNDVFVNVKTRLDDELKLDEKNLLILTLRSNETITYLQAIESKGEKFLQLAAVCRKFETEEEKTLAFPFVIEEKSKQYKVPSDIHIDFYNDIEQLKLFWNRVGQAEALRYSMNEEREYLVQQNVILKKKIHDYCLCLDCPKPAPKEVAVYVKSDARPNRVDLGIAFATYQKYYDPTTTRYRYN